MCQGSDGLHLDRVPLLQGVVQDAGRVNDLPTQVLVVRVTDVERLTLNLTNIYVRQSWAKQQV